MIITVKPAYNDVVFEATHSESINNGEVEIHDFRLNNLPDGWVIEDYEEDKLKELFFMGKDLYESHYFKFDVVLEVPHEDFIVEFNTETQVNCLEGREWFETAINIEYFDSNLLPSGWIIESYDKEVLEYLIQSGVFDK